MDKRLIDADKLLVWLSSKMWNTGIDDKYFAYESVQEAIESGEFAPDPIPLPTIKPGDKVRSKRNPSFGKGTVMNPPMVWIEYEDDELLENVRDLEVSHD